MNGTTPMDRSMSELSPYAQREVELVSQHGRRSARGNWHAHARIGIMGGTFDPIHNGHLVAASEVAWVYDLDEVFFVPTGRPVFKLDKHVTNEEDRYLMTVIATASNPKFVVSRVDIDRPGVTYTIDTLRDIRARYPDAELFFITGHFLHRCSSTCAQRGTRVVPGAGWRGAIHSQARHLRRGREVAARHRLWYRAAQSKQRFMIGRVTDDRRLETR